MWCPFDYYYFLTQLQYLIIMKVGIILCHLGVFTYLGGSVLSICKPKSVEKKGENELEPGAKRCPFCGKIIDERAKKCRYCRSFQRQEKVKIIGSYSIITGILLITMSYVLILLINPRALIYGIAGLLFIVTGIIICVSKCFRARYSQQSED